MYILSVWAKYHKWPARFIIVAIYVLLNIIGFYLGDLLTVSHITLPVSFFYIVALLFFIGVIIYPSYKRKEEYRNFYVARKTADGLLAFTTFLMIVWVANTIATPDFSPNNAYAATISPVKAEAKKPLFKKMLSLKNPLLKLLPGFDKNAKAFKKLKANIQTLRKAYKEPAHGEKIALIILVSLIASALILLLLSLSCNLSCSGSEGLALLVAVLGTGLVIFLLIKVVRRINNGPRKPKPEPITTQATF